MYLAKLHKMLYTSRKDLCSYCSLCDKLETGRCLATSEARKFWMKEKNDFNYLETLKPKEYLLATYAGALNKQRNVTCLFKVEEKIRV